MPIGFWDIKVPHCVDQCFPTFLMPRTPCSERYFTAAPINSKMEISCILHMYDNNEVINHNFTTLNVSSVTMQYCVNGDFRINMNISIRPNIMNLTFTCFSDVNFRMSGSKLDNFIRRSGSTLSLFLYLFFICTRWENVVSHRYVCSGKWQQMSYIPFGNFRVNILSLEPKR
jgi:hypothetical protein